MWKDYLFEFADEYSENCGEMFFVELFNVDAIDAIKYACDLFPDEELTYLGEYSVEEAEAYGYDTY